VELKNGLTGCGTERNPDCKGGTVVHLAGDFDAAVVELGDLLSDSEAEPVALGAGFGAGSIGPVEAVEDTRQVSGGNAWALVSYH